ncbi:MAG: radical SAM family heme chaperone HemW [Sedimentisphaerales bacterium]|nr:radical SAM family heme chaperone HemW [Sedimentisphaerales bacterium]
MNVSSPVSLYVHIPFCSRRCRYCAFASEPMDLHDPKPVIDALIQEAARYDLGSTIQTIYIGGGSPTSLPEKLLFGLIEYLAYICYDVSEFTVEANPGQVNEPILKSLYSLGVNRLSIGVQSFNWKELELLGRQHTAVDVAKSVYAARTVGFTNISLDLISAIPESGIKDFEHSLLCATDLDVEHISVYSLSYEDGTSMKEMLDSGRIQAVDEETDRAMYEMAIEVLEQAGLRQYEISNFAVPGLECAHNLTYWANRSWIGVGPSAASWYQGKRTVNVADVRDYVRRIQEGNDPTLEVQNPTLLERACETAVLNLRRRVGIDLSEFQQQTGFDALNLFAESIQNHVSNGFLEITDKSVRLTCKALPIADQILCDFSTL